MVRYGPGGPEDGEELPLGFTGPLQPLKRHAVIRSKQDEMSSEAREFEEIYVFSHFLGCVGVSSHIMEDYRLDKKDIC